MRTTFAVWLMFGLVLADGVASAAGEADAVKTVLLEQQAAWNRGDVDNFMSGYWHSPDVRFVSGDKITRGWNETLIRYRMRYPTRAKMGTLAFSDLRIDMLAPDAALAVGRWQIKRAGETPEGVFTLIFRKLAGHWVIVLDHTS
jgi:ketosteroid isomerase-like protein